MTDMRISIHVMDVPKEGTPPEIHITFTPLDHEEIVEANVVAIGRWEAVDISAALGELATAIAEHTGGATTGPTGAPGKPRRFNPRPA